MRDHEERKTSWFKEFKTKIINYKQVISYYIRNYPIKFGFYILFLVSVAILITRSTSELSVFSGQFKSRTVGVPFFGGVYVSSRSLREVFND